MYSWSPTTVDDTFRFYVKINRRIDILYTEYIESFLYPVRVKMPYESHFDCIKLIVFYSDDIERASLKIYLHTTY